MIRPASRCGSPSTTGMLGTRQSFAPVYGSEFEGDQVRLAVSKDLVKDAPSIDDDGHMAASEQDALYRHYAAYLGTGQAGGEAGHRDGDWLAATLPPLQGRDTSGPTTDDAMTRSEERLHVGTETVQGGPGPAAQVRRHRERHHHRSGQPRRSPRWSASRSPTPTGTPRFRPAAISEEEHEVTLRAERPVVAKEAVPVERVRLGTETVTEDAAGQRDGPQGADRRARRRRQPARRGPLKSRRPKTPGSGGAPGRRRERTTPPALLTRQQAPDTSARTRSASSRQPEQPRPVLAGQPATPGPRPNRHRSAGRPALQTRPRASYRMGKAGWDAGGPHMRDDRRSGRQVRRLRDAAAVHDDCEGIPPGAGAEHHPS